MSNQFNSAGKSLIIDEVIELKGSTKDEAYKSRIQIDLQLAKRDTSLILAQIALISSDSILTPAEKVLLARELAQVKSTHGLLVSKVYEMGIEGETAYITYLATYQALLAFVEPYLVDMELEEAINPDILNQLFGDLYGQASALEEQAFRYTTGLIDGLGYSVKFEVRISSSNGVVAPLDGGPVILSVLLLREGVDVTDSYLNSAFSWSRVSQDRIADVTWRELLDLTGKTLTVSIDDLVYGSASFLCNFGYLYTDMMYYSKSGFITLSKEVPGPQGIQGLQGLQGIQGITGDQGIQGPIGPDGLTAYSHIAYADDASGTGFNQLPAGKAYVGFYADHTLADSPTPGDYTWSLILGADGAQGIQGPVGADGLTSYFHIAWATSADGLAGFSTTVSVGKTYIGNYSDHTAADSEIYTDYAWTLMLEMPAYGMTLQSNGIVIPATSRGVVKADALDIVVSAILQNIPPETVITWSVVPAGVVTLVGADNLSRTIDVSTLASDVLSFYVTASVTHLGVTYTPQLGVTVVADGLPAPIKLGSRDTVPTATPLGEPLVNGDYFMASTTFTEATVEYLVGEIYVYTDGDWITTSDGSIVLSMMNEFVSLTETTPDTITSKVIAKRVYAQQAVIDSLMASFLEVKELLYARYSRAGVAPVDGSGFWLHKSGLFKAKNAELIGTFRTGVNAPTDARVGIQDAGGIISGPTFTGTGLNDLLITQDGNIAGDFQVKINTLDDFTNAGTPELWVPAFAVGINAWRSITINSAGRFVMGGSNGYMTYSDDGITWVTPFVVGGHTTWRSLAVNSAGRFVAVGSLAVWVGEYSTGHMEFTGYISYSDDGITWSTPIDIGGGGNWYGVAVNTAGRFVASGNDGYMTYSDDGITWATPFIVGSDYWVGITINSTGRFVAVGFSGYISHSDDGITWATPFLVGSGWNEVTVNSAGRFIAVGYNGYMTYSDNGITWATPFAVGTRAWNGIAVNTAGRFVAGGDDGSISYSDDGITWVPPFAIGSDYWVVIAVNSAGRFVAGGNFGNISYSLPQNSILWSSDGGTTWGSDTLIPIDGIIPLTGFDIVIFFDSHYGHTIGDYWAFIQAAMRGMAILDNNGVEYFSASDGVIDIKDTAGNVYFSALDGVIDIKKLTLDGHSVRGIITSTILSSFASPATSISGITFDSITGNLISCDNTTGRFYIHDGVSDIILSSFASPWTYPTGLAFDTNTGNLISCDYGSRMIYIHDGVSDIILSSFASPSTSISGLTFDSITGNLISCDYGSDLFYIHDGVSATILSSFASPATSSYGLAFDSITGNLISCDRDTDMIYIHDRVSATILSSFASPSTYPIGLTFTGANLIHCDRDTDLIYVYLSMLGM